MAKRLFDLIFAILATMLTLPVMIVAGLLVWAQDGRQPLFIAPRVGRGGRDFRLFKQRTMIAGIEVLGGSSTAVSDPRLTRLGLFLRRFKIDELPQFFNVLAGQMSVVGPRPNVRQGGVDRYTGQERMLLTVRPGITDLASIVFADEGEILKGSSDPDTLYDSVIRPWKNRLALTYLEHQSLALDLRLIGLTIIALLSRPAALRGIDLLLERWEVSDVLRRVCTRASPLVAAAPPGQTA
jgi:lipopolysaccharide/colanic/teichoic acid biosynthesis glycosyltransferase